MFDRSYYWHPVAPLNEALGSMLRKKVPKKLVPNGVYNTSELSEAVVEELQGFCSLNTAVDWFTGIGIMDAADAMVEEAVSNGNIPPSPLEIKSKLR